MSLVHSISIDSTSSTGTMATIKTIDLGRKTANGLYDDGEHFQSIFTNDSRFFDTSLHLFKSYYTLGYIQSNHNEQQYKKNPASTLTITSNGNKHRWRPRLLGSNNNNNNNNNGNNHTSVLKAFLTPTLRKKHNQSTSIKSDSAIPSNEPKNIQQNSQMVVHYSRPSAPTINIIDDEEPDVIITRL